MTAQQSGPPRRVVAGLGPDGRSRVVSDAPVASGTMPGIAVFNLWTGSIGQTDNAAPLEQATAPFRFEQLAEPRYAMMVAEYAPGLGADDPHMHFTNTADHFYVIEGEVVLVLESGDVMMKAGDIGICRGVMHGWRNDGATTARLLTFVLPANPL